MSWTMGSRGQAPARESSQLREPPKSEGLQRLADLRGKGKNIDQQLAPSEPRTSIATNVTVVRAALIPPKRSKEESAETKEMRTKMGK